MKNNRRLLIGAAIASMGFHLASIGQTSAYIERIPTKSKNGSSARRRKSRVNKQGSGRSFKGHYIKGQEQLINHRP